MLAAMRRLLLPVVCILAGTAIGVTATRALDRSQPAVVVRAASASTPSFVPACPKLFYAVDGTISPLFCTIDNPTALKYYAKPLKPLLALGPNASPLAVENELKKNFALTGTFPIQCEVYQLAQHRWGWNFAVGPVVPHCS